MCISLFQLIARKFHQPEKPCNPEILNGSEYHCTPILSPPLDPTMKIVRLQALTMMTVFVLLVHVQFFSRLRRIRAALSFTVTACSCAIKSISSAGALL